MVTFRSPKPSLRVRVLLPLPNLNGVSTPFFLTYNTNTYKSKLAHNIMDLINTNKKLRHNCRSFYFVYLDYFATSVALDSLITLTLIWPGYSISLSIFFAISFARNTIDLSSTSSGLTIILTSLPAWIAYAFSTPLKLVAMPSSCSNLLIYASRDSLLAPGLADEIASAVCTIIASKDLYSTST